MQTHYSEKERIESLIKTYKVSMDDEVLESYYEGSNYHNVGLWGTGMTSQKQACINLMNKLLDFTSLKQAKVLDVACGLGATTHFIAERFSKENVTGINISPHQVMRCKENYPDLDFRIMNATDIQFADETFDLVISVEAAIHFNTRKKFLSECARILKPSGQLILSDLILSKELNSDSFWVSPPENTERTIQDYEINLVKAGFTHFSIENYTQECWIPYSHVMRQWALTEYFYKRINEDEFHKICFKSNVAKTLPVEVYLLATATKG